MPERSKDRIDEGQGDLNHAKSDMRAQFYNWACFSAQQAAEKAVKAVFQKMGAEAWGHSVMDLLKELSSSQKVSDKMMDRALELDKAYIPTRYPNAHPSGSARNRYTKEEARRLISHAERIVKFCEDILSRI